MVDISLDMIIYSVLFVAAVAGWATVYAQRRALLECRKAFQFLGMKDAEAEELTDVDYEGQDVISAMQTVLLAMKEQKEAVKEKSEKAKTSKK